MSDRRVQLYAPGGWQLPEFIDVDVLLAGGLPADRRVALHAPAGFPTNELVGPEYFFGADAIVDRRLHLSAPGGWPIQLATLDAETVRYAPVLDEVALGDGETYGIDVNPGPVTDRHLRYSPGQDVLISHVGAGETRSEISAAGRRVWPVGSIVSDSFEYMLAAGSTIDSSFFSIFQIHSVEFDGSTDQMNPVGLSLQGTGGGAANDKLQFGVLTTNDVGGFQQVYISPGNLTRDVWHQIAYEVKITNASDGYAKLWVNGVLVGNYTGPTCGNLVAYIYFKGGIYRGTSTQTAHYRGLGPTVTVPVLTNLLTGTPPAGWGTDRVTLSTVNGAMRIRENDADGEHVAISNDIVLTSNGKYRVEFDAVRAVGSRDLMAVIGDFGSGGGYNDYASFPFTLADNVQPLLGGFNSGGGSGLSAVSGAATKYPLPDGWYRCSFTFGVTAFAAMNNAVIRFDLRADGDTSYDGDNASAVDVRNVRLVKIA